MSKYKKEIQENEYLFKCENLPSDQRFNVCLKWYIRKACFYKTLYYSMTLFSGICPIIVAALNGMSFGDDVGRYIKYVLVSLSVLVSVSVVILSVFRAQEKWTRYRAAAEFLKSLRMAYIEKKRMAGNDASIDSEFLKVLEEYMSKENMEWQLNNTNNKLPNSSKDMDDI